MANFHDKIVLNKYLLSLFGISAVGEKIIGKDGVEIFKALKDSNAEGYTEEGNTKYLALLKAHLYLTESFTETMLQQYDENIVRHTRAISEGRDELLVWKYFQYLSLLFTEVYLDKYFSNKTQLQHDLNAFVKTFNANQVAQAAGKKLPKGETIFQVKPFEATDLNKLAFWNATGSGKTLLMHVHIKQYLHYAAHYNKKHAHKILLITPNDALSKQHLLDFKLSGITANLFSKNQTSKMFDGVNELEIMEISKLSEESKEKTVAVDSFETHNLVLVDEGHGGMSGEQWKRFRDQLSKTGFAFEYSATFGQAISAAPKGKKTDLEQEYAKSILFDYSYKYFYSDGYGKDYRILNLKEDNASFREKYMTANLLSFYQQLLIFKDKPALVQQFRLHKPLWVFVGSSVNAVRTEDKRETSDVLDIIHFLSDFLKHRERYTEYIKLIIGDKAGLVDNKGYSIFEGSFHYLSELDYSAEAIFEGINKEIFHNDIIGANLYIDNLRGAPGELGLRVGDTSRYFGVVNVGDEKKLYDLALNNGVLGAEKDFSASLFAEINAPAPKHAINLLIGSKKFSEGWSSWRVSSMGLMNIGKSEGSQIIQLFGRGVRLQGYEFSLKRSKGLDGYQKPTNIREVNRYLRPLETLQIFGVKANYMEQFKKILEEEGLPQNEGDWVTISVPTQKTQDIAALALQLIQVKESENFKKRELIALSLNTRLFQKPIEIDWYPKIDMLSSTKSTTIQSVKHAGYLNKQHLKLVNWTSIYFELQTFKATKGYANLALSLPILQAIISDNTWYKMWIPEDEMSFNSFKNIAIWQELVITLLKKYTERYYLYYKNKFNAAHVEARLLSDADDNFLTEYDFRLNRNEDTEAMQARLKKLQQEVADESFAHLQIASEIVAFATKNHLYKPIVYVGEGYGTKLQVQPIALDQYEKRFVEDVATYFSDKYETYLLRNQSKKGIGFFADGHNFYPDFILWIKKEDKQYITFIDPKGLVHLRGINDPKIQFFKYLLEQVQPQVAHNNIILNSFILSNTRFLDVNWKDELEISDFNNNNVLFVHEQAEEYMRILADKILSHS